MWYTHHMNIIEPRPMSAKHQATNRRVQAEWMAKRLADGWGYNKEYRGAGLPLIKGRRFLVKDKPKPGWYKFDQHVINPKGVEWIECYGPFTKNGTDKLGCGSHAIAPERIARVEQATPAQKAAEVQARKAARKADRERAKDLIEAA